MEFLVNSRIAIGADWICEGLIPIVGVETGHLVDSIKFIYVHYDYERLRLV